MATDAPPRTDRSSDAPPRTEVTDTKIREIGRRLDLARSQTGQGSPWPRYMWDRLARPRRESDAPDSERSYSGEWSRTDHGERMPNHTLLWAVHSSTRSWRKVMKMLEEANARSEAGVTIAIDR